MITKLIISSLLIFIAVTFNSCEVLNSCKICKQVTYIDGAVTHEGAEGEYCDAALIAIETNPDFVDGNKRISWECR
jgi:hypothetical protein